MNGGEGTDVRKTKEGDLSNVEFERPAILSGYTVILQSGCGKIHVTINFDGARPVEVYVRSSASGGCAASLEVQGRLISRSLQLGLDWKEILKQLHTPKCTAAVRNPKTKQTVIGKEFIVKSCADGIAKAIELAMELRGTTINPEETQEGEE